MKRAAFKKEYLQEFISHVVCIIVVSSAHIRIASCLVAGDAEVGAHLAPVHLVQAEDAPRVASWPFRRT